MRNTQRSILSEKYLREKYPAKHTLVEKYLGVVYRDSNYETPDSVMFDCSTGLWRNISADGHESVGSQVILCEVKERPTTSPILSLLRNSLE